jgi:hypothetical protein
MHSLLGSNQLVVTLLAVTGTTATPSSLMRQ